MRSVAAVALAALVALVALVAAACSNDKLATPATGVYTGGAMFQRYVALGNSITSGYQSGGINDSTQRQAYPVVLAAAMGGDPFYYPSLAGPGCPPPYTNIFTGTRLGPASTATTCYFRSSPTPPYVSDVAVPGAYAIDLYTNGAGTNSNALTQLFLGGRTQVQAMAAAQPTFVSVWIGNNDVLDALLDTAKAGDSTVITPLATFQTEYQQVAADVKATGAQAVLIGVANVTEVPYASLGSTYFAIKNGLVAGVAFPATFIVGPNCAPSSLGGKGDSILVPFPFGAALVGVAAQGVADTLHCTEIHTVQPAQLRKLIATVLAYNTFINATASANDWAYLDPNPTLDSLRLNPAEVAPFPNLQASCSASPFGLAFSCDGFHPSGATHLLIARHLAQAINAKYGSAIPAF
ncbi:MAG TPA: SGNH/GDSL hydrolase family protein [Gemmatimonadales bacterium]|nr:SGNH/GDSL hydrolase family protein [Gemmatimonadales bacterium]